MKRPDESHIQCPQPQEPQPVAPSREPLPAPESTWRLRGPRAVFRRPFRRLASV